MKSSDPVVASSPPQRPPAGHKQATGELCKGCHAEVDEDRIVVRTYELRLCDPCVDGTGSECHTPGCALFFHRVDLPITIAQVLRDEIVIHSDDCPKQDGR